MQQDQSSGVQAVEQERWGVLQLPIMVATQLKTSRLEQDVSSTPNEGYKLYTTPFFLGDPVNITSQYILPIFIQPHFFQK